MDSGLYFLKSLSWLLGITSPISVMRWSYGMRDLRKSSNVQQPQSEEYRGPQGSSPWCCYSLKRQICQSIVPYLAITLALIPLHSLTMMGRIGFIAFRLLYWLPIKSLWNYKTARHKSPTERPCYPQSSRSTGNGAPGDSFQVCNAKPFVLDANHFDRSQILGVWVGIRESVVAHWSVKQLAHDQFTAIYCYSRQFT